MRDLSLWCVLGVAALGAVVLGGCEPQAATSDPDNQFSCVCTATAGPKGFTTPSVTESYACAGAYTAGTSVFDALKNKAVDSCLAKLQTEPKAPKGGSYNCKCACETSNATTPATGDPKCQSGESDAGATAADAASSDT